MLEKLKRKFTKQTWIFKIRTCYICMGNVGGIDRIQDFLSSNQIRVDYDLLTPDDIVVVDLNGNKVEEKMQSIFTVQQLIVELVQSVSQRISEVVHTHSSWATKHCRPEDQSHVVRPHMQIIFMVKFHVHAAWKAGI